MLESRKSSINSRKGKMTFSKATSSIHASPREVELLSPATFKKKGTLQTLQATDESDGPIERSRSYSMSGHDIHSGGLNLQA